jgi:tetratricopeptide (TPR) repeat protein
MDNELKTTFLNLGKKPLTLILAVFLLGTLIFLPTLGYDFVWDDSVQIKENSQIRSLYNWPLLLVSKVPVSQYSPYYRPLFMFSLSWDYAFFKENPWGYHLTSSLIHGLNSSLVTYLALLLLQNPYGALIAGALFAFHPAHAEAVAFIGARVDLLATLFSLLALIAIAKKTKKGQRLGSLLLGPLFFFLALLSKETAAVALIPVALLLYQRSPAEGKKLRVVMLKILPYALMLVLYFFLRGVALGSSFISQLKLGPYYSPFFLFELFSRYISFLIFPPQRSFYLYEGTGSYPLGAGFWLSAGLVLLFLTALGYLLYRRRETALFLVLLILPCLPPIFYSLYIDKVMLERYLYLPTVGLALLAAWGFLQIPPRMIKRAGVVIAVLLVAYGGATLWRIPLWKSELALFEALKKQYPSSPFVRSNLGMIYLHEHRLFEAYQEATFAVSLKPQSPNVHRSLGWIYLGMFWTEQARAEFAEANRLQPNYALVLEGLGLTYLQEGNKEKALEYMDMALRADPGNEIVLKRKKQILALEPTPPQHNMKNSP